MRIDPPVMDPAADRFRVGTPPPVRLEINLTTEEITETDIVNVVVNVVMVDRRLAISFEKEDTGAVVADNVATDLDGRVAEIDRLALVLLEQVVAEDEARFAQATAVDIIANDTVFHQPAGKMGMQGVGGVADLAIPEMDLF